MPRKYITLDREKYYIQILNLVNEGKLEEARETFINIPLKEYDSICTQCNCVKKYDDLWEQIEESLKREIPQKQSNYIHEVSLLNIVDIINYK